MDWIRHRYAMNNYTIVIITVIVLLALSGCSTKQSGNISVTPSVSIPTEATKVAEPSVAQENKTQENAISYEQRKEYFALMKDVGNLQFLSNFSSPLEIKEDELVLFGYMKASEDKKTFSVDGYRRVRFNDITPYIKKYFNCTITGKRNTNLFTYDTAKDEYVPKGWGFDGAQPHYLCELTKNNDGSFKAVFDVYFFSEGDLEKSPEDYISNIGSIPADINHIKAESTFYIREQEKKKYIEFISYKRLNNVLDSTGKPLNNSIKAVSYKADEYLSDDEFVIAGGVKLGMSYEEVLKILGSYDQAYDNAPGVKSIIKDGYHYGFYQINETFTDQSDLKMDSVYYLLNVTLDQFTNDEFPRGIKIGDNIEYVLSKFPGKDKKLREWAYQSIYGENKIGKPRANLQFTMFDQCYSIYATTTKRILIVRFDRKNCVKSIELHKEDS
jgi:hypothetical protein